ncbi:hypothetical protein E4U41_001819 [Claviceps citrina]|nr:hypothetical protein E4U41_001819 [Claviceps citrina]
MAVHPAASRSTETDARHHVPSISTSSLIAGGQKTTTSTARRRILALPRITWSLAILAALATFSSFALAERDALIPKSITPASIVERGATFSSPHGGIEHDELSTASTALSERASGTSSDGGSSPLPSPFDNLVPSAFQIPGGGDSCPKFMSTLLSDPTFKRCYPISMLIQTSSGFFNAQKQLVSLVQVLDAACAPDVTQCTDFLSQAARNLTLEANCQNEYEQNQTQVLLAYRGLRAYNVMYSATCLQNPAANSYCFADAVTNQTNPSNTYLYFMPYGLSLPGASKPTCNWCTQTTMAIYHSAAADRDRPVASKYEDAAQQVNTLCGPSFVNSSLPAAESAALLSVGAPSGYGLVMSALFAWVLVACLL